MKTALIIEDEIPAAERLSRLVSECGITVVKTLRSNAQAIAWLQANDHPEIIFADIALRDGLSFGALEKSVPQSAIIFVTAYDHFALEAFAHGGVDYLLKPVTREKLMLAIGALERKRRILFPPASDHYRHTFLVAGGLLLRKVLAREISHFESGDNVTKLFTGGRCYPMTSSLDKLMDELDPAQFFRVSRKAIVNHHFIAGLSDRNLVLADGLQIPVSRSRMGSFLKWLKK